jgi:Golgi phosphoprotein 3 (GPP34)
MGIAADLMLLAIDDRHGKVRNVVVLGGALAAADLVELVLAERVVLDGLRLVMRNPEPTGDVRLDTVLRGLVDESVPTTAGRWVADRAKRQQVDRCARQLAGEGSLRGYESSTSLKPLRVHIADRDRASKAVKRLVDVAQGKQRPLADKAFAALADAVGLAPVHLSGRGNREARERMAAFSEPRSTWTELEHMMWTTLRAGVRAIVGVEARSRVGDPFDLNNSGTGIPPGALGGYTGV